MSKRVPIGFLNINKPLRMTSHDVVAKVRRQYRAQTGGKKVGHAGTLDPLADGVLVICLGAATRLSEYIMRGSKLYRAFITFGATTSTYDAAGERRAQRDTSHISRSRIEAALPRFIGEISQIPPMYSAIKQKGQKLYELARQGKIVDRPARKVAIHNIEIVSWQNPVLELTIHCAAGAYIRSLAHDLGQALDVGAYLSGLTRLASGAFEIENSTELKSVVESDEWMQRIVSPFDALSSHNHVILAEDQVRRVREGQFIQLDDVSQESQVFAFDVQISLVAVLEPRESYWKPHKVFPDQS